MGIEPAWRAWKAARRRRPRRPCDRPRPPGDRRCPGQWVDSPESGRWPAPRRRPRPGRGGPPAPAGPDPGRPGAHRTVSGGGLPARGARLWRRLSVAVDPARIDQHGGAPLLGHDPVVLRPVPVPAAGRGEHRAQQQAELVGVGQPRLRVVGPGRLCASLRLVMPAPWHQRRAGSGRLLEVDQPTTAVRGVQPGVGPADAGTSPLVAAVDGVRGRAEGRWNLPMRRPTDGRKPPRTRSWRPGNVEAPAVLVRRSPRCPRGDSLHTHTGAPVASSGGPRPG
jgi:hypothetical protein